MRLPTPERRETSKLSARLIEHSLQFYYEAGSVSRVFPGEVVTWRTMPFANIAYISGGCWKIEREDRAATLVQSGEACCIPSGVRHRSVMLSQGSSESRWAHFNVLLCGYIDLFSFFDLPAVFRGNVAARMGEILLQLAQLSRGEDPFPALLRRKILEFELASTIVGGATPKYHSDLRVQQIQRILPVLQAIDLDLAATHTRGSLAALAHLSPSRFSAVFKEAVGLAPIDYVVQLRMQRARQMLPDTAFSIEQIAAKIGYGDAFYFSRLFKAHFGMSPRQYRSRMQFEIL